MFNKLIFANSNRARKNNVLYFSSMIISIVAFYIILSFPNQDVMKFLRKMESDALGRIFSAIPIFYIVSLAILFFLVYFASSLQIEKRLHEFGMYLTLGMRKSKLFSMLLLEDLRNNMIALGFGLPIAITFSEFISLVTAKIVGLGIIGHRFSLSFESVVFTIFGFLLVKFVAIAFLSIRVLRKQIGDLLTYSPAKVKKTLPNVIYLLSVITGVFFLSRAYYYGISNKAWENIIMLGFTIFLGTAGTILLFCGLRLFIEILVRCGRQNKLHAYNFRQIQESIIHRSNVLAICSLLIFAALCLFGAGAAISISSSNSEPHVFDYTFRDEDLSFEEQLDTKKVIDVLKAKGILANFSKIVDIKIGYSNEKVMMPTETFIDRIKEFKDSKNKETLIQNLGHYSCDYLISLSGYNEARRAANLKPIKLKSDETCLYMDKRFVIDEKLMNAAVKMHPSVRIAKDNLHIVEDVQTLSFVTDRAITITMALIVPDKIFMRYTEGRVSNYVNGILDSDIVKAKGLMKAISDTNDKLDQTNLKYESYLQNMGRQLFFIICTSYITIYLAIILLVVANTIISIMFLMGQRKTYKRYQTLIKLGASYEILRKSSRMQINWYFGLPIAIAVINSFFGVRSLLFNLLSSLVKMDMRQEFVIAILIILLLGIFETIYIMIVKKNSDKFLWTLMETKREE